MDITKLPFVPAFVKNKIKSRPELQQMTSNFVWLLFDKVLRILVFMFVNAWMARFLGPKDWGLFNYSTNFATLFAPLTTLGLNAVVIREIIRKPERTYDIIGSTFLLKLVGAVVLFVVTAISIFFVRQGDTETMLMVIISASGYLFLSLDAIDLHFQSQLQSKYTVIAKDIAFLLVNVVKMFLLYFKADLMWFIWVTMLEMVLGSVFLIWAYRLRKFKIMKWNLRFKVSKDLIAMSWPMLIAGLANNIQGYIDQIMLADLMGNDALGQYSAAFKLIVSISFIPMIIYSSVAPDVTKAKQNNESLYYFKLLRIYQIMFIISVLLAIPIVFLSDFIILFLYGNEYTGASFLLSLMVVRLFFANFGVAKTLFITNNDLFKYSLLTSILGALFNILLNYILIPIYSAAGAIYASFISYSLTIFLVDIFYKPMHRNLGVMLKSIFDIPDYFRILRQRIINQNNPK